MAREMRITDSKDALRLEGVGMLAFSLVALCYISDALRPMLLPFGMLLLLNGIARVLLSAWFYDSGSTWRRLSQLHGWVDALLGAGALLGNYWGWAIMAELFAAWLLLSGYFHVRRHFLLKQRWPGTSAIGALGILSIVGSGLVWCSLFSGWPAYPHTLLAVAVVTGSGKVYAAFKLGAVEKRSTKEETMEEQPGPFSPIHLN
jgi:uncharacterized membrane protein HdeD (DUF308 family)